MNTAAIRTDMLQFVTFKLSGQKYAVEILKVQEINNMKDITPIPNAPGYVEGAINLRGKVIPVLNLRKKFRMTELALSDASKIIIINVRGIIMGAIVDSVSDVLRITSSVVEPLPAVSSHIRSDFILGVAKLSTELVILLDMDKLLDSVEQQAVFGTAK